MKPTDPLVFVVDDDASVREGLASLIASASLRVECFASSAGSFCTAVGLKALLVWCWMCGCPA